MISLVRNPAGGFQDWAPQDRKLMLTELSAYDLANMSAIIREDLGDWFSARLLRALHGLLPYADRNNQSKLYAAFPGTCAAYITWYRKPSDPVLMGEERTGD